MIVGVLLLIVGFSFAAEPESPPAPVAAPASDPSPPALPADGPPADAPAPVVAAPTDTVVADALYLEALAAWRVGDAGSAIAKARAAQEAAGGVHEPSALLEGYALLRLGRREEGMAKLHDLAIAATASDVRRAASRTWHRYADRNARDNPSVFGGLQVAGRFTGKALAIGAGYTLGYDQPLAGVAGVAVELSGYDTSAGTAVIEGPVLDLLGSVHVPFGGSAWALRLKAGPAIWFSHGAVYGADLVPNLGTRAVLGIDTRPWPAAGFFFDAGAWAWPGLAASLPAFQFEWDVRAGMVFWIRPPQK